MNPEVIIFFVGLTVWSAQSGTVTATLPRVVYSGPWAPDATLRTAQKVNALSNTISQIGDVPHVENHKAAIVFHKSAWVSSTLWDAPKSLPENDPNSPFEYIPLDGDNVTFTTTGVVTNLATSLQNVVLPKLRDQLCPAKMQTLNTTGAAAVFSLPYGTVKSCMSIAKSTPGNRLDARFELPMAGNLEISLVTTNGTKELKLKPAPSGNIEVLIINVPTQFYQGIYRDANPSAMDGMSHANAYYAMGNANSVNCDNALRQWFDTLDTTEIEPCDTTPPFFASSIPPSPPNDPTTWGEGANFECSNSQWP